MTVPESSLRHTAYGLALADFLPEGVVRDLHAYVVWMEASMTVADVMTLAEDDHSSANGGGLRGDDQRDGTVVAGGRRVANDEPEMGSPSRLDPQAGDRQRGWSQADMAAIFGRPLQVINEIIAGKRGITPETARGWPGVRYQRGFLAEPGRRSINFRAQERETPRRVSLRAKVFSKGPIKEMVRRGWIKEQVMPAHGGRGTRLLRLRNLDDEPNSGHAARKSTDIQRSDVRSDRVAVCRLAIRQRRIRSSGRFTRKALGRAICRLKELLPDADSFGRSAGDSRAGRHPLRHRGAPAQTRIDGACSGSKIARR